MPSREVNRFAACSEQYAPHDAIPVRRPIMSAANIATIQRVYEAFGKGDVPAILDMVTDDVDWASESTSSLAPWHGNRRGKAEVTGFFEKLAATAEVLDFKPLAFAANDDGDVMVTIQFEMKIPATGRS